MTYPATPRTTSLRKPEKLRYDTETVHSILDEGYICHVGYQLDGEPRILPTAYARAGDTVYFHGSTGSRAFLAARDTGLDVCLTVTLHDGLVFSRSWFHHSANYRCVIAHGTAHLVDDPIEKWDALAAIVDATAPGRAAQSRPPTDRELAQTGVLALRLREVSVRSRSGGPADEPSDLDLPYWAGHVPLRHLPQPAVADDGVLVPLPDGLPGQ